MSPADAKAVYEDFDPLGSRWNSHIQGTGALEQAGGTLRLVNADTTSRQMANAQVDDYRGLPRRHFAWRPPLTMTARARFSHPAGELSGTAGFGFWNDPFMMTGKRWPTLPRALWFFYASPPSNMKLDVRTPGHGWKAATIDALRWPFFLLAPLAPIAIPLMNVRPLYRTFWPIGQRTIGVCEAPVGVDMTAWHTYVIRWESRATRFQVDGETVLAGDTSPQGPLGFVMWLDNQYMVVTPWGKVGYGWLDAPGHQWVEVDTLAIEPG
jgi:hypothetical protein